MASSLCEIPMPSRTTRKSTRPEPQIDPWLPTCNRRACQFQKPIGVVATKRRWSWDGITRDLTQDQRAKRQNRTPRIADRGWKSRKSFSTSGQGRKNVLDIPSYRSGDYTHNLVASICSALARRSSASLTRPSAFRFSSSARIRSFLGSSLAIRSFCIPVACQGPRGIIFFLGMRNIFPHVGERRANSDC